MLKNQMRKGTGSDYIKAKRQNAIYVDMQTNAQLTGTTVNPVKKNGYVYNNLLSVLVPNNCSVANGCYGGVLTNAQSYQLRLDFKQGKYYNGYVCNCANEIFCSVLTDRECECANVANKNVINCLCTPCAFNRKYIELNAST